MAPGSVVQKRCFTLGAQKYRHSTASTVNPTAITQWINGHTAANSHERCTRALSHSPKRGPTIITPSATSISTPTMKVSSIAIHRVLQKDRVSPTPHATFRSSIPTNKPPEETHNSPNN